MSNLKQDIFKNNDRSKQEYPIFYRSSHISYHKELISFKQETAFVISHKTSFVLKYKIIKSPGESYNKPPSASKFVLLAIPLKA